MAARESMGDLADRIYTMRDKIAAAQAVADALTNDRKELENKLMALMQEQSLDKVSGSLSTCSISKSERAGISSFDDFAKFVYRNKALHLLEKRPAQLAVKEMEDQRGKPIPGLQKIETQRLNVTKR